MYAAVSILGFIGSRFLAAMHKPGLLKERARFADHNDAKSWDKLLSPLISLGGGIIPLIAGLDKLLSWSGPFSMPLKIAAFVAIIVGYGFGTFALTENRFFSNVVCIQAVRGHSVISSGPYRWVRHPGYAGAFLVYHASPLFLDSAWALVAVLISVVASIVRTSLEDKTLREELEGYEKYTRQVRYRLFPGIW